MPITRSKGLTACIVDPVGLVLPAELAVESFVAKSAVQEVIDSNFLHMLQCAELKATCDDLFDSSFENVVI